MDTWKIAAVNSLPTDAFVKAFADVGEHSPWVAEGAEQLRPFSDRWDMISAFVAAIQAASSEQQLSLLRAHPDLAGKAARTGEMAEASIKEQAGAGLDTLSDEEFTRFTDLNTAYRNKNGFPFIFAVKGADKYKILAAFESRLGNDAEREKSMALHQIGRIVRFRLEDLIEA